MNTDNAGYRPVLLDLFCKAGGAAMGYHRAGFDVVGVDIDPQPRYPFTFVQADALSYFENECMDFDVWHASPPCQRYSTLAHTPNRDMSSYGDLIEAVRDSFQETVRTHFTPWIIENVVPAPLNTGLVLCGSQFGLNVFRHRAFESNVMLWNLPHGKHTRRLKAIRPGQRMAQYFSDPDEMVTVAGHLFSLEAGSKAMGIDWMNRAELAEAIPPAYTEYIGMQLLQYVQREMIR